MRNHLLRESKVDSPISTSSPFSCKIWKLRNQMRLSAMQKVMIWSMNGLLRGWWFGVLNVCNINCTKQILHTQYYDWSQMQCTDNYIFLLHFFPNSMSHCAKFTQFCGNRFIKQTSNVLNYYLCQGGYVFARLCLFVCMSVC